MTGPLPPPLRTMPAHSAPVSPRRRPPPHSSQHLQYVAHSDLLPEHSHSYSISGPVAETFARVVSSSHASQRSQRVLEIGHVFTVHRLVNGRHVSDRAVIFVLNRTLYACKFERGQTTYRRPFARLLLDGAVEVMMGKQTPALRLADDVIDRRCFAIHVKTPLAPSPAPPSTETDSSPQSPVASALSSTSSTPFELEAPGSGDVKYWLRCFLSLLTDEFAFKVNENLHFIHPTVATPETIDRIEQRIRQARIDGQRARRKEEFEYRTNAIRRMTVEYQRTHEARVAEIEHRARSSEACSRDIDRRVSLACDGECRIQHEEALRLKAIERIQLLHRPRRPLATVNDSRVKPSRAFQFVAANMRSASLQTHTNQPIVLHSVHYSVHAPATPDNKVMQSSRSQPNLVASAPPSPPLVLRQLLDESLIDQSHLKKLPTVLPPSAPSPSPIAASVLLSPTATPPLPMKRLCISSMSTELIRTAPVPVASSIAPPASLRSSSVPFPAPVTPNDFSSVVSPHSSALTSVWNQRRSQLNIQPLAAFFPNVIPSLPMVQVYNMQHKPLPFPVEALKSLKQAPPMPEPVKPAAPMPLPSSFSFPSPPPLKSAAPMPVPAPARAPAVRPVLASTSFSIPRDASSISIHVEVSSDDENGKATRMTKPNILVRVTTANSISNTNTNTSSEELPPSYSQATQQSDTALAHV